VTFLQCILAALFRPSKPACLEEMYMPTLLSMKIWPKTKMSDVEYFYSAWDSKKLDEMGTSLFFFLHIYRLYPQQFGRPKKISKNHGLKSFKLKNSPRTDPRKWRTSNGDSGHQPSFLPCMFRPSNNWIACGLHPKLSQLVQATKA